MSATIRVLAIHAHPDDVEFVFEGALALLREGGSEVTIATMSPGDCSSAEHDCATMAQIRHGEALAWAAVLGADYLCLEFRDLAIFNDDDSHRRVVGALSSDPARSNLDRAAGRLPLRPWDGPAGWYATLVSERRARTTPHGSGTRRLRCERFRIFIMSIPWKALTPSVGPWRSTSTST